MNLKELEDFKLSNAFQFHNELNPVLFRDEHMIPAVRDRLLEIADDFMEHLGVNNIDVKDITLSGSNASYTYTPHSDIDLHILVDIKKLDHDEIYAELFHVKKIIWNLQHDITIGGYEVELYVQDSAQPVVSRGEYSILNDRWIKFPTKRVADINEPASKSKFEKLVQVAELALKARDMDKIEAVLDTIRKYRKAGLESQGEFSPENIAFKAFRTSGLLHRLRDAYNEIHSEKMSMEQKVGKNFEQPIYSISELAKMHGCSRNDIISELKRGIKFEMANTSVRSLATEMAYKNLAKNRKHYSKLRDDYDPNGVPPGPEFKPTMPKGTVRVDVSDVYDWYKLGQHISNMKGLGKHDFGKGPPSTILSFGDEDTEHKYIKDLEATGLTTTDIDPIDPNQPKGMKRQKVDPTFNVNEASGSTFVYHVTPTKNLKFIAKQGLVPTIGDRSSKIAGEKSGIYVFPDRVSAEDAVMNWLGDEFDDDEPLTMLKIDVTGLQDHIYKGADYELIVGTTIEPSRIKKVNIKLQEASGTKIDAHRVGDTIWINYFEVPVKGKGLGTAEYEKFEKSLPKDIKKIRLVASDAGYGPTHEFWDRMGFDYAYPDDDNEMVKLLESSGYIPSESEKDDPRFKTALTVDIKPDSIRQNAIKLGLGKIKRSGIPPIAKPSGKF